MSGTLAGPAQPRIAPTRHLSSKTVPGEPGFSHAAQGSCTGFLHREGKLPGPRRVSLGLTLARKNVAEEMTCHF